MIEIIPNWHPIFVHFTIAPLLLAALLYLLAAVAPKPAWRQPALLVARWNLFLGVAFTAATVVAGFNAYNSVAHDDASHAAMTDHRNWAVVTALTYLLLALWEGWRSHRGKGLSWLMLVGLLAAGGLLATTGFKGGEVVFRHGLGVMRLPQVDSHRHGGDDHHEHESDDHDHGEAAHDSTASGSPHGGAPHEHHAEGAHAPAAENPEPAGAAAESPVARPTTPEPAPRHTHVHPDGKVHTH